MNGGEKSPADKVLQSEADSSGLKEERPGLGSYIWSLITGSGRKCKRKISVRRKANKGNVVVKNKDSKNKSSQESSDLKKKEDEDSDGDTFGIQKTEKLKYFVKPRPPTNRRRPTSTAVSSRIFNPPAPSEPKDEPVILPVVELSEIVEAQPENEEGPRAGEEEKKTEEKTSPKPSPKSSLSSLQDTSAPLNAP